MITNNSNKLKENYINFNLQKCLECGCDINNIETEHYYYCSQWKLLKNNNDSDYIKISLDESYIYCNNYIEPIITEENNIDIIDANWQEIKLQ